jgi:hypothetical protein
LLFQSAISSAISSAASSAISGIGKAAFGQSKARYPPPAQG